MNSSYHSSFPPFSIDLNEDLYHDNQLQPVAVYASSSSLPNYPFFINPSPQEAGYYQRDLQPAQLQDQANIYVSGPGKGSFCDHETLKIKNDDAAGICKKEEGNIGNQQDRSLKWVSSKMRLMKKMISSDDQTTLVALPASASSIQMFDHDQEDQKKIISSPPQPDNNSSSSSSNNNNNNTIRVCSDCNTTKTPLWRSGPRGPKSLCNACGIRQRKARRAMAAAAAAAGSTIFGANNDHEIQPVKANVQIQKKEKKPISTGSSSNNNNNNNNANNSSHLPFKKRCTQKAARAARKININSSKICLEDLTIILSKKYSSSFQRVFPQDEKDAAILLMALSYGALVHG